MLISVRRFGGTVVRLIINKLRARNIFELSTDKMADDLS